MEQFKINAIAHLILDHLSGIRDYFEAAIGTTNNQDMEINMFHAIDDFAAEIYVIIEKYKNHPWKEMQNVLEILKHLPDNDGSAFQNQMRWFDKVRQENFAKDHLEIANAMRYI